MFRVLKPGGLAIVLDPCVDGIARKAICRVLNFICNESGVKMFQSDAMREMFENSGFGNVRQNYFSYYKLITVGEKI